MNERESELKLICKLQVWVEEYKTFVRKEPQNTKLCSMLTTFYKKLQALIPKYSELELRLALNGYFGHVDEKDATSLLANRASKLKVLYMKGDMENWTIQQRTFERLENACRRYMDANTNKRMSNLQEATDALNQ